MQGRRLPQSPGPESQAHRPGLIAAVSALRRSVYVDLLTTPLQPHPAGCSIGESAASSSPRRKAHMSSYGIVNSRTISLTHSAYGHVLREVSGPLARQLASASRHQRSAGHGWTVEVYGEDTSEVIARRRPGAKRWDYPSCGSRASTLSTYR